MGQTNIFRLCQNSKKLMIFIMLLLFTCITSIVLADMPPQNVAVETDFGGSSNRINGAGSINLRVTWQGDSPPFTAKFKKNGNTLLSDPSLQSGSANTTIPAATWGDTNGNVESVTVEIIDAGGRSGTGTSQGFIVDTIAPQLSATITNEGSYSQSTPVRIQITSNETINAPQVTCEGTPAQMEGSLQTGTSFVFNLPLSGFSNGQHIINIEATDTTYPENGANRGTTTVSFTLGTTVSGDTKIESCNPPSPTNAQNVTLNGVAPNGATTIKILDNGSEILSFGISSSNWTYNFQPEAKDYSLVAVSYDNLNQEISRSSAFTLKIDRQAPNTPTFDATSIPTQTNQTSISLQVAVDGYNEETSTPVYLQAYNNDNPVGSQYNITSSGSPVNVTVPLSPGTNKIYFKSLDAAGNQSAKSAEITINQSGEASGSVASILIDGQYPVPAPTTAQFGSGNHTMTINLTQECNAASTPIVEIICGGGSKITVAPTWGEGNKVINGTFSIPNNGGATVDGAAQISIKDIKDMYGNTLNPYTADSALLIDSTPPTSTFTNPSPVYISSTNSTITLQGTVTDNENGSGIDYLELFENVNGTLNSLGKVPLQTGAQSPWSYAYDASGLPANEHTLVTSAVDRAIRNEQVGNAENAATKTGITLFVDQSIPGVERISLNNTGIDISTYGENPVIASDITRIVVVASDTGSGLDLTNTNYIFKVTGPNGDVTGEKTNNNVDTIYFDFPVLTAAGEYTITVTPVDKAGNAGETVTRKFTLNKSAPDSAEFHPPTQTVANKTYEDLASSSVKVILSNTAGGAEPSHSGSSISVKYNGVEVGTKNNEITDALVAKLHDGNLMADGSHDGNYYITVTPRSTTGVTGTAITSSFIYDTQPPVVVESTPSIKDSEIWFGLNIDNLSITVSDGPKDILENYSGQYPTTASAPVMPGDTTWYNGSGSGINYNVSTFTWNMGGVESTTHNVSGTKFTVKRPPIPEDTAAGVADVDVTIVLADNVTQGASIPNINSMLKTYKFDYLAPKITLGTANGKKFCKNLLKVEASAEDQGSDENLQVTKIEYKESTDSTWKELEVSELPKKMASFTLSIDISGKSDGNYKVSFRAVDRTGNTSEEVEFSYIVDRTPPNPPELTIPLADYTVNKRNQSFKWLSVDDASAYLFQVSDDSSFNNVLNNQASSKYPGLKGFVSATTDGSLSLPKDGTYYWRVACIEECADGYNISEFSETRKVIIDTVKPYILSISPSPSSSNCVSTGMVTFTVRFSEPLDSTIDLNATLTSAGGQVMKIEKVSCTGDTWVGTTVIPKNNSAVYDGNAIIAVDSAADLAGNLMEGDSSHTIVVNTGPAFTTKLFSNPANEYEITIITKSSESLQTAPSVTVRQNSEKTPITMNFLKDRFYSGSYKIDKENPGSAYINISATDLYGNVGTSIVEFIIADVNASSRLNITSASGRASLKAAESSTYTPTAVYMIDRETLESPFAVTKESTVNASIRASAGVSTKATQKNGSELVGVLGLDEIGPSSVKLKKCMLYTADVNGEIIDNLSADKIHVYRQDSNGNWIFQGGELKNYKISAQITGLGRLALMADKTSPRMSSLTPSNQTKLKTNLPEIKGQFVENGSGLETDSFKLYIDGMQVKDVELNKDGSFSYQVKKSLKEGKHEIKCEVSDKAGNSLVRAVTVDAPAEIRIGEFSPYPNPARGNRISFAYNFGARPTSASLKVYDSAGHMVAKFGPEDFDRASGLIRWDLINRKGKKVANGTYIYRLEITANGQKITKRGKFAVLR